MGIFFSWPFLTHNVGRATSTLSCRHTREGRYRNTLPGRHKATGPVKKHTKNPGAQAGPQVLLHSCCSCYPTLTFLWTLADYTFDLTFCRVLPTINSRQGKRWRATGGVLQAREIDLENRQYKVWPTVIVIYSLAIQNASFSLMFRSSLGHSEATSTLLCFTVRHHLWSLPLLRCWKWVYSQTLTKKVPADLAAMQTARHLTPYRTVLLCICKWSVAISCPILIAQFC